MVFALIPLLVLLILAETVVRVHYYLQHDDARFLVTPFESQFGIKKSQDRINGGQAAHYLDQPSHILQIPRPCQDYEDVWPGKTIRYTFNEDCLRDKTIQREKPRGVFRIAVIGGSTVFGIRVSDEEAMPARLEHHLNAMRQADDPLIQVINAGYPGAGAAEFVKVYQSKLRQYGIDLLVHYEGINHANPLVAKRDKQVANGLAKIKTGSWISSIHNCFYFNWMTYTYLVEKYQYLRPYQWTEAELKVMPLVEEQVERLLQMAHLDTTEVVFVKQVLDYPLMVDGHDLTNRTQAFLAYEQNRQHCLANPAECDVLKTTAINTQWAGHVLDRLAASHQLQVIDFQQDYAQRSSADHFIDICHQNAAGNDFLAKMMAQHLMAYLQSKQFKK